MINNIKELIKNRNENENISSKLDQEVLINYKVKLHNLEEDNSKLIEEYNSLKRNFEALCLKNKEDLNMIKKLEAENTFLRNKIKTLELNLSSARISEDEESMKAYKDKIESLNSFIKSLENRITNSGSKMQEKEMFYKNYIAKLEEKNKLFGSNQELLDKENQKMKKEIKRLEDNLKSNLAMQEAENDKLIKEQSLLAELEKYSIQYQKEQKEKELIEKLLYESRDKIKNLENQILEHKNQLKALAQVKEQDQLFLDTEVSRLENENKFLKNELNQLKIEIEITFSKYISEVDNLKIDIETLKYKEKEYLDTIENLEISLQKNSKRNELLYKFEIENISKNFENIIEQNFNIYDKEITKLFSVVELKLSNQREKFEKVVETVVEKLKLNLNLNSYLNSNLNLNLKLNLQAEKYLSEFNNKIKSYDNEFLSLKQTIKSLEEERKKIKYDLDSAHFTIHENERKFKTFSDNLEKKIEKKRNKIYSLRNENERITNELKEYKQNKPIVSKEDKYVNTDDLDEEKNKLKSQLSSLAAKIKLSVETLTIILSCRSCNDQTDHINKNLQVLKCGHSICKNCVDRNLSCYECGLKIISVAENLKLNDIILRINFLFQLNGEVEDIVNFINSN